MKKNPSIGERIKSLRGDMTQAKFADLLKVGQTAVSAWELDENVPSSEAWAKLGNLAPYPENIWFWQQAGMDEDKVLSAAEKLLRERGAPAKSGEIVRVPRFGPTPQGREETGPPLILPAEFVPNPGSTSCFILDEQSARLPFAPGDMLLVDGSQVKPQDPRPFWEKIVLVQVTDKGTPDNPSPKTFFTGKLEIQRDRFDPLTWYARLVPVDERFKTAAFMVGDWRAEGGIVSRPDPSTRLGCVKKEAEEFAPEEIRLYGNCEILGVVTAWFAGAAEKRQQVTKKEKSKVPETRPEPKKTGKYVHIGVSSQIVGKGPDRRVVPQVVQVYTEWDLTPDMVMKGPVETDQGNLYITCDGKKLRFNKAGDLL